MNVEEFVKVSLMQINNAVRSSQKSNVLVDSPSVSTIAFDIAVTVSDIEETGGKAGLLVYGIGAGIKATEKSTSSIVSRIKFEVPVTW